MSNSIAAAVLPEFDQEMASTRKVLERIPEARASWKPHSKSYSLGDLAAHVSNLPSWTVFTLKQTELDLNPPGGQQWKSPGFSTTAAALAAFDENVKAARAAIAGSSDADFQVAWSLKSGGHTIFSMPRAAVLRSFVLNHLIHHRAQLTVYLRLNDVPLPGIYGPTADEVTM